MRTCERVAFRASRSARLATGDGASRIRCRSFAGGVTRVNYIRSTLVFVGSISLVIVVYHGSAVSYQPHFPFANWALLIYTHSFFSLSV